MEVAFQQVGIDEARADIGKMDFQAACIGLLLKSLEIDVLHRLGGGIGGCRAKALCACNACDSCDMSLTLFREITVSLPYHAGKTHSVGIHGVELYVGREGSVLFANS